MPTPTKGPRLGGSPAHEKLMLANLATSLFRHGRITTTEVKAKRLRPLAEQLITKAKRGDLHARRRVLTVVRDKDVVFTLFDEIAPRFANRPGGYTRIVKTGPRKGDAAPMAIIELVEEMVEAEPVKPAKSARRAAKAEAVAALAGEDDTETTVVKPARQKAAKNADPAAGRAAATRRPGDASRAGATQLRRPVRRAGPPVRVPGDRRAVGRGPGTGAGHAGLATTAGRAVPRGRLGGPDRRARLRRVLQAQGARHHDPGDPPAGLAPRAGRHPGRHGGGGRVLPGDGAQPGRRAARGRGRPAPGRLAGRAARPYRTGQRGGGGAAARADPGGRRVPG